MEERGGASKRALAKRSREPHADIEPAAVDESLAALATFPAQPLARCLNQCLIELVDRPPARRVTAIVANMCCAGLSSPRSLFTVFLAVLQV